MFLSMGVIHLLNMKRRHVVSEKRGVLALILRKEWMSSVFFFFKVPSLKYTRGL